MVDALREGANAERHPSDGGGRAWIAPGEDTTPRVHAGGVGRFHVIYEAGPEGIAPGGVVYLQVSPFWGWSTPQVEVPEAPGYTEVEVESDSAEIVAETLDQQLLGIRVVDGGLATGDRIHIRYGLGPAGVRVDTYAEEASRLWIAVDGDGDGVRQFLADSPTVRVEAGPAARLVATLPTTAQPGDEIRLVAALLDRVGNTGVVARGDVEVEASGPGLELPARFRWNGEDGGRAELRGVAREPGVYRVRLRDSDGREVSSNPLVVGAGPRILWGDVHGHSALSDGTGSPDDYFVYAREVAGLDVVALTDHDHWGILPLAEQPALFESIERATQRHHEPGRFVTVLGFEWTSWIHGHRHVLYFDAEKPGDGAIVDSLDPRFESPLDLWKALAGRRALTFAHHSAGGPIPTNWEIPPDPHFEPVTEITSVHGSSEAPDAPRSIYRPVAGNFVRDVLGRGYQLGFIGSGDSHDGHPGLAQLAGTSGGLAAILSEELTRDGVEAALRARRVYATNGPRIFLRAALGEYPMGSVLPSTGEPITESLYIHTVAPEPLERVDVIRSGAVVDSFDAGGLLEARLQLTLTDLLPGESVYVRVVQADDGAAWSSPVFVGESVAR